MTEPDGLDVLFLDIDGVCNHFRHGESYDGDYPDGWFVERDVPVCPDNLKALKSVLKRVERPAVVWSTDWRLFRKGAWNGWRNPMSWLENEGGLKKYVIGSTPKKMSSSRHDEIMLWLRGGRPAVRNFAALDDIEYGMGLFGGHYFRCDPLEGLTEKTADAVVELLSRPADMSEFRRGGRTWIPIS